jgi:hypothetical protein
VNNRKSGGVGEVKGGVHAHHPEKFALVHKALVSSEKFYGKIQLSQS